MSSVRLSYRLGEHGWAGFSLQIGGSTAEVEEFGYCTDALGDLIRVASEILSGETEARVSFDGEPFEWRLILRRSPIEATEGWVDVQILTFNDISADTPDEDGSDILTKRCLVSDFAFAVAEAAQVILDQHGEEEYNRRWGPEFLFPLASLRSLQTALTLSSTSASQG